MSLSLSPLGADLVSWQQQQVTHLILISHQLQCLTLVSTTTPFQIVRSPMRIPRVHLLYWPFTLHGSIPHSFPWIPSSTPLPLSQPLDLQATQPSQRPPQLLDLRALSALWLSPSASHYYFPHSSLNLLDCNKSSELLLCLLYVLLLGPHFELHYNRIKLLYLTFTFILCNVQLQHITLPETTNCCYYISVWMMLKQMRDNVLISEQ